MRALLVALLFTPPALITPLPALAGTVTITVGSTQQTVKVEPGKSHTHPFTVGRFQVRLVTLQQRTADGDWSWDLRLERTKDGEVEVLAHPQVSTPPGLEAHLETGSKLGPIQIHCRE